MQTNPDLYALAGLALLALGTLVYEAHRYDRARRARFGRRIGASEDLTAKPKARAPRFFFF